MKATVFAVATFVLQIPLASAADDVQVSGTAFVLDGDTLEIAGHRIRLHGIDAPELAQHCTRANGTAWACGAEAKSQLEKLVRNSRVNCVQRDVDRYRRIVAVCNAANRDINAALVREGWAVAYREYSADYVDDEQLAQAAKRGIWAGRFENPEDYRLERDRAPEVAQPAANCTIKGNINSRGDRIFHVAGGEFYDDTQIDTAAGERWFCSEREARAAGWRKSRR